MRLIPVQRHNVEEAVEASHFPRNIGNSYFPPLQEKWSPEQIADYLEVKDLYPISFQSIYRIIRIDRWRDGFLFFDFLIMPKPRRKCYVTLDSRGVLQGKRLISKRHINNRLEFGHRKGGPVMGRDRHQCFLTLVERKLGFNKTIKNSEKRKQGY